MPRPRRYVSAIVPAIGFDMANSRRADSGEPAGTEEARSAVGCRFGSRQLEKASRFLGYVVKIDQAATFADHVEEIAVLAGGGISPFAGGAAARRIAIQAHKHRAARGVPDIADLPIVADATAVGEIVTAYRLRLAREAICQVSCISPCHAAARSETRESG